MPGETPAHFLLPCRAWLSAEFRGFCKTLLGVLGQGALGSDGLGLQELIDLQGLDRGIQMATPRPLSSHKW